MTSEFEIFTQRMMEDDLSFFLWINGNFAETVLDYYIHLKMNEAQEKYGS